jgi:hypothetical protein
MHQSGGAQGRRCSVQSKSGESMKINLLKKCRKAVRILNNYGTIADRNDKKVNVVIRRRLKDEIQLNSKGMPVYINYGNAQIKRRETILRLAKELYLKPWIYHVFH